ncbi:sperm flagellar protein 1 [Dendroctonus ponderosae]
MEFDLDELFRWIDDHEITRQKKNLTRDFSDAVPLAEILKKHYPKLVELHNYAPRNAVSQKLINWEILNKKVLNKLKINLNYLEQEQLAKAAPGGIEKLLHKIKLKVEKQQSVREKSSESSEKNYFLEGISSDESPEDRIKNIKQKLMPVDMCNKMEADIMEKNDQLLKLQQKVDHLENMLIIKDERINDLTRQLQAMANGDGDKTTSPRTRFFNKIF